MRTESVEAPLEYQRIYIAGYFLYFGGLRYVPASRGASLFYVKPILAITIAFIFLGEPITIALLIAALLAAGGVLLVTNEGGSGS